MRSPGRPAKARRLIAVLGCLLLGFFGAERSAAQNNFFATSWSLPPPAAGNFTADVNWNNGSPDDLVSWAIDNGGTAQISSVVFSQEGYLGFTSGQSGTLQILNGGVLTSGDLGNTNYGGYEDLVVGRNGSGTLEVEAGGLAVVQTLFGAGLDGSVGTVNVNGGTLDVWQTLHVGDRGTGSLTLAGDGTVKSKTADIGRFAGASGNAVITDGLWENEDAIFVGVDGNGTLEVDAQGRITSKSVYIGQNATGATTVSGGSIALSNTLAVGVSGTGNLTLTAGGHVGAEFVQVGFESGSVGIASLSGNSSMTASQFLQVGVNTGSTGTVTLDDSSLTVAQTLTIGQHGSGTLVLTNDAHLEAGAINLATASGASGSLSVTGSTVTTENINVGSGNATAWFSAARLQLPTNVVVVDTLLIDGFAPGNVTLGSGGLTVDTRGGNAQIGSPLSGAGSLTKTGVGRLRLDEANGYSGGTLVEQGLLEFSAGSAFGTGGLTISTAELRAITNATLSTSPTFITVSNGQTATFSTTAGNTLTLATSDFTVQDGAALTFGSAGNTGTVVFAPVNVTASSNIPSVSVQVGTLAAGNARLAELTAQASTTTVASGATLEFQDNLSTGGINALFGAGTVNTGTNSATTLTVNSGNFSGSIAGWGDLVKESAGTLTLSGQNGFAGTTTVNGGTLVVDGSLGFGLGNATVNNGGTIGGTGLVGVITLSGGTVSPGSSPGTLNAESLFWEEGTLRFELGPTPATSDLLVLSSQLVGLGAPGTTYTFDFVDNGWTTNTYDLITFNLTDIDIGDFNYSNGGGFAGTFGYTPDNKTLQFTVTTVPEPGTISLLAGAALAGWLWRARRRR